MQSIDQQINGRSTGQWQINTPMADQPIAEVLEEVPS
jgi:hypothetical protein